MALVCPTEPRGWMGNLHLLIRGRRACSAAAPSPQMLVAKANPQHIVKFWGYLGYVG